MVINRAVFVNKNWHWQTMGGSTAKLMMHCVAKVGIGHGDLRCSCELFPRSNESFLNESNDLVYYPYERCFFCFTPVSLEPV